MPQISKIRIVNFQYNDGKRLIADELFDFARGDKGPSDVLINLANGGGKSVLVQLIMQPIIPRAKVAGRRIESFFTKSTDHCFVGLEWSLDNSKTKLMTGIAMAASDATGDPDAERGFRIKYYTFLSRYSDYRGSCNIISLPLSMKENGRFVPAGFDDIRALSRRVGSELIRFSSDESVKWREQLEEYGIFQDEWKVIEELNSNEDGLSKYFSTKKTSDAVIDQLILPRIEEKLHRSASPDDSSLETMLISYAEQFSRQKDTVREREILAGFSESLKTAKEQTEKLWSDKDALDQRIGALFAFHDALKREIDSKKADVAALQSEQTRLRAGIAKIQWEKASAEYYAAEKAFHLEIERYQKAEADRTAAEDRRSAAQKKLKLLECARYLQELRSIEDRIAVIEAEIISRETRSESAQQLAALKYSAHAAIESSLRQIIPEITGLMEEKASGGSALQTLETELRALLAEVEAAVSEAGKAEGIWKKQCGDNDALVETLGIGTLRMFNGEYPDEDIQNWKSDLDTQALAAEKAIASSRAEIAQLEARKEAIPQELANVNRQAEDFRSELQELDGRIAEFKEHEARVRTVCNNYDLDFSLRFADKHRKYIAEQIESVMASIGAEQQKLASVEEAAAAAKRGTLHIPRALLDFLDGTGLSYISLEKYLLTQQNTGLLKKEQVKELLEQYPYAAYGIILDDSVLPTILKEAEDQWLPALLPVITKTDVEQMMRGEADAPLAIAAFSRDYFADADAYVRRLETDRGAIADRIDQLAERQKAYQDAADILESFSAYEESWLEKAEKERADTESAVTATDSAAAALKAELAHVKGAIEEAKNRTDALQEQLGLIHEKNNSYAKLLTGLKEEARLSEAFSDRRQICDSAKKRRSECEAAIVQKQGKLSRISEHLKELTELRAELQKGLEEVSGAPEAELIPGDWASLLNRYRELLKRQSEDLQRLTADRDLLYNEKAKFRKELERRACRLEDYAQLFYSEELETAAIMENDDAEAAVGAAQKAYDIANRAHSKAETSLEHAKNGLAEHDGTPLPPEQVGAEFETRIKEAEEKLRLADEQARSVAEMLSLLEKTMGKAENAAEPYPRPPKIAALILSEDHEAQLRTLTKEISEYGQRVRSSEGQVKDSLHKMLETYGSGSADVRTAVAGMQELIKDETIRGDRYYSLIEHIENATHSAALRISQIDTDLGEFHKTRGDLIRQCVIQGKRLYEGLQRLSSNSKVKVQEKRRPMIKFDIPDQVDERVASAAIAAEVEKGAKEIAARLLSDSEQEAEIRKLASMTVGSKQLLRKYIGVDSIVMKAYKIDRTPANSGYRTWKETQVNNSGAEKFVVYFAVILALMSYAREDLNDPDGNATHSVLVLDNPFGPISSKHVLEPMFDISRNYHVQMICLSDISKSDIVSCFDYVIRAIVKPFALSSKELLTHEGNETIEHGFYRSEQIDLFDRERKTP